MTVSHENELVVVEVDGITIRISKEDAVELAAQLLDVAGRIYE